MKKLENVLLVKKYVVNKESNKQVANGIYNLLKLTTKGQAMQK
jgi:hypothetical protein